MKTKQKEWTDRPACADCGATMAISEQFQVFEPQHVCPLCLTCYGVRLKHDGRRPGFADDDGASLRASGAFYAAQLKRGQP